MLFPVTDTIKDIETEVMNILIGKDAAEWVAPYVPFGKEPDMKKVESGEEPKKQAHSGGAGLFTRGRRPGIVLKAQQSLPPTQYDK